MLLLHVKGKAFTQDGSLQLLSLVSYHQSHKVLLMNSVFSWQPLTPSLLDDSAVETFTENERHLSHTGLYVAFTNRRPRNRHPERKLRVFASCMKRRISPLLYWRDAIGPRLA